MSHVPKFIALLLATVALQAQMPARAADAPVDKDAAALIADEEERVDEGLKQLGYLAGLARACVVEKQRVELERDALDLHAGIGRLLVTDRAFLFATSFGYGTTVVVETKGCA